MVKRVGEGGIGEKSGRWEIRKISRAKKNWRNRNLGIYVRTGKPYWGVGRLD